MFERLYTTKMSADKKSLQKRFSKIRSHNGKFSKVMAMLMASIVAVTMLCATIVMAAVGSDGLEYWDKNEIYFRDGIKFTVNVTGKNVPTWVFEDIAGEDGNIDVTIRQYELRDMRGIVSDRCIAEFSGAKGSITQAANVWGGFNETAFATAEDEFEKDFNNRHQYQTTYRFIELVQEGGFAEYWSAFSNILTPDTEKNKCINIKLGFDENKKVREVYVRFRLAEEDNGYNPSSDYFEPISANSNLVLIGDFEKNLIEDKSGNLYFTSFESNYKNPPSDSVKIEIERVQVGGVVLNTDISLEHAEQLVYHMYNKDGRAVAFNRAPYAIEPQYTITPAEDHIYTIEMGQSVNAQEVEPRIEENPLNDFIKGEHYRICVAILDKDGVVLYRWQDYITIP